jgi:hypothetical protein
VLLQGSWFGKTAAQGKSSSTLLQPLHQETQLSKLCIYTLVALKEENAALLTNEKIASSLRVNREYSFNGTFFLPLHPDSYLHPLHLEAKLLSVREHVKVSDR